MKLIIIGGIIAFSFVLFLIKKFRKRPHRLTKIYIALIFIGALIALAFGPPKYVLQEDTLGLYRINAQLNGGKGAACPDNRN